MEMGDRWGETASWTGDGLRREAFFFQVGSERLYGSIYAADPPLPGPGTVICNSWGFEGNQSDPNLQGLALGLARSGGAAMVFHYPGFGDSEGDLGGASLDSLTAAAVGAAREASRRVAEASWGFAGLMFGASVATVAAVELDAERLLMVQPTLRPSVYFSRLERSSRRMARRIPARAGYAYGYPLPDHSPEAGTKADATVAEALQAFEGEGAVVRYSEPPRSDLIPERFEDIVLPGTWRFGMRQKPDLARAAVGWLVRARADPRAGR